MGVGVVTEPLQPEERQVVMHRKLSGVEMAQDWCDNIESYISEVLRKPVS